MTAVLLYCSTTIFNKQTKKKKNMSQMYHFQGLYLQNYIVIITVVSILCVFERNKNIINNTFLSFHSCTAAVQKKSISILLYIKRKCS